MLLGPSLVGLFLLEEAVRVSAARSAVDVPAEQIATSAAPTLDDALRQVPGFTLFRRTGSRTANPTTQGVSLRGIGPSGASRTAVLDDGVPLNDPFGGWVAWGRVPLTEIARVEVVRAGASDLFGSGALGGALRLFPRHADSSGLVARLEAGGLGTEIGAIAGDAVLSRGVASAAVEVAHVDGYVPVAPEERGPVDEPAGVARRAVRASYRMPISSGWGFLRGAAYDEKRGNGTPLQDNDTEIRDLAAGFDRPGARVALQARAWTGEYRYHQTFTAVSGDRTQETLVRDQHVPSDALGASLRTVTSAGAHTIGLALEGQRVTGTSRETVLAGPTPVEVEAGGAQRLLALSAEDDMALPRGWRLEAGLRADAWRSGDRTDSAWSPRLALSRQVGTFTVSGAAYSGFRAPTLNELHRTFRVGDVTTLANPELTAETLAGGEAGLEWRGTRARARAALFVVRLIDAIANVTLSTGPDGTLRQRENLGATRTRGLEADLEADLGGGFTAGAGLLAVDPEVVEAEDPALTGNQIPQVSRLQGSLRVGFRSPRVTASLQARGASVAYEDDRNTLTLPGYGVLDLFAETPLGAGWTLFAAGENVLDARVVAGRTPVTTLATPRTWRIGIRVSYPRRATPPSPA
jgi:outer membrane receptor protein involved in Fe transport